MTLVSDDVRWRHSVALFDIVRNVQEAKVLHDNVFLVGDSKFSESIWLNQHAENMEAWVSYDIR